MPSSAAAEMNRRIAAGRGGGLIDRLGEVSALADDHREEFREAMADFERSVKRGDEVGRDMADARIDRLLNEARAARQPLEEEAATGFSFDGGMRRSMPVKRPVSMDRRIRERHAENRALAAAARRWIP